MSFASHRVLGSGSCCPGKRGTQPGVAYWFWVVPLLVSALALPGVMQLVCKDWIVRPKVRASVFRSYTILRIFRPSRPFLRIFWGQIVSEIRIPRQFPV